MDFRLTRRGLLIAALPKAAQGQAASLSPDGPAIRWPGLAGQVTLPGWSPRTMALPPIAGTSLTAVALTDTAPASTLEILLLARNDGKTPRILALEVLQWQSPEGRLNARVITESDPNLLIFDRTSAIRKTPTLWLREVWRDFLGWDSDVLVDHPLRQPMRGSQQATLALFRSRTYAWLKTPRDSLSALDLQKLGLTAREFNLS